MHKKRVAIHQPNFAAWPGFFYKVMHADVFVVLDDAQYSKRSFQNRNKILTAQGPQWLTVPVRTKGKQFPAINAIHVCDERKWRGEHIKSLAVNYGSAPYFRRYRDLIESVYAKPHRNLASLNSELIFAVMDDIGLRDVEIVRSSEVAIDQEARRTERLVQLCEALGADVYVSGAGAKKYQDESLFIRRGIELMYASFTPFPYPQVQSREFHPYLSILDYLFNRGGERFREDVSRP